MSTDRWEKVEAVFSEAASMEPRERALFLTEACRGDQRLRAEVDELLEAHDVSMGPLDRPLFEFRDPSPALSNDQVVDERFRIRRFVGRGGMGEVYEAEDLELGVTVALKTLLPEHLADPQLQARFKREIHLARRVTHPNVCRVFDLGKDVSDGRETNFLTMQFLEGLTLADHLRDRGRLPPEEVLPLVRQMADGLAALAEAGIVHRDFKPGNIMITPAGAHPRVVIMDFGLARPISAESCNTILSSAGLVMGTPAYMAPEQLLGEKVGPFSDVYALAVVTYELLTGSAPFKGHTAIRIMLRKLTEAPPPPTAVVPELDAWWDEFVLRCMERNVERRVQSPQQVLRMLDERELQCSGTHRADLVAQAELIQAPPQPLPRPSIAGPFQRAVAAIRNKAAGWWPWGLAAGTTVVAAGALMVGSVSLSEPLRLRLCDAFPGSTMFCVLPADKDLALLPFTVNADSQSDEAIGRGLATFVTSAFYRLYPNKGEMCVHLRDDARSDGVKLKVVPTVIVAGGIAHFQVTVREATPEPGRTTGRVLRRVDRSVSLGDLEGLHDGLLLALADALELKFVETAWAAWTQSRPTTAASFVDFLQGLGLLRPSGVQPAERRTAYEAAARLFTEVISPSRDFVYAPAHVGLGEAYRLLWDETGDDVFRERAENAYRRASGLDAENGLAEAERHRAKLDMDTGRVESRIARLEQAIENAPYDHYLQKELAEAYESLGRDADVERLKRLGIDQRPECWLARNTAAAFYSRHAMLADAENNLLELIKLTPRNVTAYRNLAMDYVKAGRYAEAVGFASQAIQMGGLPEAYVTLGQAYYYGGCRDDAFENLQEAVTRSPDDHRAWLRLAEAAWATPDRQALAAEASQKANTLAQAVIKRESEKPARVQRPEAPAAAHAARALSLAYLGLPRLARQQAALALELGPKNHEILIELAKAYELIGDRRQALDRLKSSMMGDLVPAASTGYSPVLDWFRQDHRFQGMLGEFGAEPSMFKDALPCPGWGKAGLGFRAAAL